MTLDKVTSLADLAFKAKTNKYYRQLAVIASLYLRGNSFYRIQGRPVKDESYAEAMEFLVRHYKDDGYEDCSTVVQRLNELRGEVIKEPEPKPEVKPEVVDASALKKSMGEKIIAELKKKNLKAKTKTVRRGVRSSTVSRSTVTRTRAGATRTRTAPTRRRAPSTRR
jgi:hypothetical protein